MFDANLLVFGVQQSYGRAWIPASATMWKSLEAIIGLSFSFGVTLITLTIWYYIIF